MHPLGRPEGDFSTFAKSVKEPTVAEKDLAKEKGPKATPFALVFLPHTSFSFRGRMGR